MSRSAWDRHEINAVFLAIASIPLAILAPTDLAAQQQSVATAEDVIVGARKAYGPPPPKPKCDEQQGDEIVVCAEEQEQSQFRVKSSNELDPTSEEAINDGVPRAPDVGGAGIFKGPATIGGLCVPGLQKCPPPPVLFIDFSKLPDAPPGSDADRIARGLPPLGDAPSSDVAPMAASDGFEPETGDEGDQP